MMWIGIMPVVFVAVVLLICVLVGAASSGRVWAVVAGLFGTLLLLGGGLLLVGFLWVVPRTVGFENRTELPTTVRVEEYRPPALPSLAEAPELFPDSSSKTSSVDGDGQIAERVEQTNVPSDSKRPAWMEMRQGLVNGIYRKIVKVGPWSTRAECEQQLPEELRLAIRTYADHHLGAGKGKYVNLDMAYVHNHLVRDEYEEKRQHTFDTMTTLNVLLEFDRDANEAIEANYKQAVVTGRLGYTAAGSGGVLGVLAILFGYFKLDTLTRGYYTGRLRLTAATAILALAAIAGLLVLA